MLARLLPIGGTTKRLGTVTVPICTGENMGGNLKAATPCHSSMPMPPTAALQPAVLASWIMRVSRGLYTVSATTRSARNREGLISVSPSSGFMPTLVAFTRMSQRFTASASTALSSRAVMDALQPGTACASFFTVCWPLG